MNNEELKQIIEAVLFATDEPLNMNRLMSLLEKKSKLLRARSNPALNRGISQLFLIFY